MQDLAAHAHRVGEQHGKQEHLTGPEQTGQELDAEAGARRHPNAPTTGHGVAAFGHNEIAALAHRLWVERGSPEGSPDVDWHEAAKQLRARTYTY